MMRDSKTCLVLGGGIAGASVAWHLHQSQNLARRSRGAGFKVTVIEKEASFGRHATSQNAAMIRALAEEAWIRPLSLEGQRFWNQGASKLALPKGAFRRTGSLLLASQEETAKKLQTWVLHAKHLGISAEFWDAERCRRAAPCLCGSPLLAGAYCPDDGIADPLQLTEAFLRGMVRNGGSLRLEAEVETILVERGRVRGVQLTDGTVLLASTLVVAAGAWSPGFLRKLGLSDRGIGVFRRHIHCSLDGAFHLQDSPGFLWHLDLQAYVRVEGEGLLFSACDADAWEPGVPKGDPTLLERVSERLSLCFPFLQDLPISRYWAGLRSYRPDHRFLLGEDPEIQGLFHATALGGHGITCAAPVGRVVAEAILAWQHDQKAFGEKTFSF